MQINILKLNPDAITPTYAHDTDACFDLYAPGDGQGWRRVEPGIPLIIDTGIAFEIPPGWCMKVYSRSGHGFKHDTRLANCVGIIDAGYTDSVKVKLASDNGTGSRLFVRPGDRIAQAMLEPVQRVRFAIVDKLGDSERGTGGFGSTGA